VDLVVDLAPGAEHEPLAQLFAEVARDSVRDERTRREFERLRGAVGVVADDSGSALTLRFDFGRLTIHEGLVGIPTVTIRGTTDDLEALLDLPLSGRRAFGLLRGGEDRRAVSVVVSALGRRRLKIYGLVLHAPLVIRVLRVLSRRKGEGSAGFDARPSDR
jgi:hypothetical protein